MAEPRTVGRPRGPCTTRGFGKGEDVIICKCRSCGGKWTTHKWMHSASGGVDHTKFTVCAYCAAQKWRDEQSNGGRKR